MRRQLQIGIIGSMGDISLQGNLKNLANLIGKEVSKIHANLLFSFEGDFESLPVIAAKSAERENGKTIAFLWGNSQKDFPMKSTTVVTGQQRGGGREFSFILSCNAIICIGGGSGSLMEITMAYQAGIPVVVIKGSGGWSDKLRNTFLDERKRLLIFEANSPKEAVEKTIKLIKNNKQMV